MKEFGDELKLYYFKNKKSISLSIRLSSQYVLTFYIPESAFQELLDGAAGPSGSTSGPYFLMYKKEYVRLTIESGTATHNFRLAHEKWNPLIESYREKRADELVDIVSCVVK
jgi:hypothetical protein